MYVYFFFFFKQKTSYEMRISDWSSDVFSSDLAVANHRSGDRPQSRSCRLRGCRSRKRRRGGSEWSRLVSVKGWGPPWGMELGPATGKIGRASCRGRVCQYEEISVVAVSLKKKTEDSRVVH